MCVGGDTPASRARVGSTGRRPRHRWAGRCALALAASLALGSCGGGSGGESRIAYELVSVGNPGNADDATGFGGVAYAFRIGKYAVTIGQYAAFLNAVAATDTYALYDASMSSDLNSAGISRSGSPGSYTYGAMDNDGSSTNRPITYVSWFDAARFANWMANGQPRGAQDETTTENGAYALNGATSGVAVVRNAVNPNTGAAPTYFIPLEDEWYKAAYYSPELDGGAGGYYLYATQSDTAPGNAVGDAANQANYFTAVFSVTQSPDYLGMTRNYLTDVGAFSASPSFYGTFDQDGNVWEWNDLDGTAVPYRGLRGGYWWSGSVPLQSVLYSTDSPARIENGVGFRLASPQETQ
jgi:sulfatase modifying factor 1